MIQKLISKYSSFIIGISIIYIVITFAENFFKSTMLLTDVLLFVVPSILLISSSVYVWKNKKINYLSMILQIFVLLPIIFHHTDSNRYLYIAILFLFIIVAQLFGYTMNHFKKNNYK